MSTEKNDPTTAGSGRIPREEAAPVAPSGEQHAEQNHPAAPDEGQENSELEWAKRHVPDNCPPSFRPARSVFRKTELHYARSPLSDAEKEKRRRKFLDDLGPGNDPGSMTGPLVEAFREIIDAVLDRQELLYAELLAEIADLRQEIDAREAGSHRPDAADAEGAGP